MGIFLHSSTKQNKNLDMLASCDVFMCPDYEFLHENIESAFLDYYISYILISYQLSAC